MPRGVRGGYPSESRHYRRNIMLLYALRGAPEETRVRAALTPILRLFLLRLLAAESGLTKGRGAHNPLTLFMRRLYSYVVVTSMTYSCQWRRYVYEGE